MAMTRCEVCTEPLERRVVPQYRDAQLGLPGVVLLGAVTELVCRRCKRRRGLVIPNLAGAIAAASVVRIMHPLKLTGEEMRTLRKVCGWSAKDFAAMLGVRAETLSRWETGREPLGAANEKLIRLAVGLKLADEELHLVPFDSEEIIRMELRAPRAVGRHVTIPLELVRADETSSAGAWDEKKAA
jgi:transcriptional regulator with XRE-family HTH domain